MKQNNQKRNWLVDAVLFGGFVGSLWLDLTGVTAHQWLGLTVGALAGYHLWKHWTWVKAVTARFLGRTSRQSRTYYVVDAGLSIGFSAISVTGLAISTWLNLPLASYATWLDVHVAASIVTLAMLVVKIGLHWRWIVNVAQRNIFPAFMISMGGDAAQLEPVATQIPLGRRDFVRLMGGVGVVALLSGAKALGNSTEEQVASAVTQATASTQTTATPSTLANAAASSASSTSSTCRVRCNKRCSYPGHCRKYVDSNKNRLCDLGECLV